MLLDTGEERVVPSQKKAKVFFFIIKPCVRVKEKYKKTLTTGYINVDGKGKADQLQRFSNIGLVSYFL